MYSMHEMAQYMNDSPMTIRTWRISSSFPWIRFSFDCKSGKEKQVINEEQLKWTVDYRNGKR